MEPHNPIGSITELHNIVPLDNVRSIFERGLLSHNRAEGVKTTDISNSGVQDRRATKIVDVYPDQIRTVHDYAVMYFNASNPMLFTKRDMKDDLCVLRLKPSVILLPNAVISDRNASTNDVRFFKATEGVRHLSLGILFGQFWNNRDESPNENKVRGHIRCAELMVPDSVHPSFIGGVYVASEVARNKFLHIFAGNPPVPVLVHPNFFFTRVAYNPQIPALFNRIYPNPILPDLIPQLVAPEPVVLQVEAAPQPLKKRKVTVLKNTEKGDIKSYFRKLDPTEASIQRAIAMAPRRVVQGEHLTLIKGGDLFKTEMRTLVNTVNCEGVMGKGIAKAFKERYPDMFEDYYSRCKNKSVVPGKPYLFVTKDGVRIINFPTKDKWKDSSEVKWITSGLTELVRNAKEWGIESLAIPALGCGNGGLNWNEIRPLMCEDLSKLNIPVEIYTPD
jgi:O-acetyl-ADP-ribose deacetylase (regulator of RNase III)